MDDLEDSTVSILLLGDDEVGKSTFLSRLSLGRTPSATGHLPTLRDTDQPFIFNIRMYNRPYRFEFSDTASPTSYYTLRPDLLVLCYDITRRATLYNLKERWKHTIDGHFNADERIPVVVVGLKRDLREEWTAEEYAALEAEADLGRGGWGSGGGSAEVRRYGRCVMPQEGVRVAQEMRADRYAECSALTGELCQQVLEDISRTAAMTTTEKGGRTEGGCVVL